MYKILIVEDNEPNREILAKRLEEAGYIVIVAENGQEAIDKAASESPHLILMDISLPVIDSSEVTRILKGNLQTKKIPIIALVACSMHDGFRPVKDAGCEDHVNKPIDFKQLLEKMAKYLKVNV